MEKLIQAVQCGQRNICMAEVSCKFKIGMNRNTIQIDKVYQVVCFSLRNGQCPKANDCVLDRSMVSAREAQPVSNSFSGAAAPQKSSSGVR